MNKQREAELRRYRTYIQSSGITHPTFDMERYYTEMSTQSMIALRDKTVKDLERNPNFAPKFYGEFVEYLNQKLAERKTLKDWLWRNTVLKLDLIVWRWKNEIKNV
jgi:hypothetical protein